MKKFLLVVLVAMFVSVVSVSFAADGQKGGGSSNPGVEGSTPSGFGEQGDPLDEDQFKNENSNFSKDNEGESQGAWGAKKAGEDPGKE